MAVTKTIIANLALTVLEAGTVANFDAAEGSLHEDLRAQWEAALDMALADHPWNFASKWWRDLAAVATALNPSPEWSHAIAVPSDCLRVLRLYGEADFEVMDNYILTDDPGPISVKGIRRVTETGKYSIWFAHCFAARLAQLVAKPATASEAVRSAITAMHEKALSDARSLDGREGGASAVSVALFGDSFLASRDGYDYGDW